VVFSFTVFLSIKVLYLYILDCRYDWHNSANDGNLMIEVTIAVSFVILILR